MKNIDYTGASCEPLVQTVKINGHSIKMELDTGASVTIISESTYTIAPQSPLHSKVPLKTYTGDIIQVLGSAFVEVEHDGNGSGPNFMGRNWLNKLGVPLDRP